MEERARIPVTLPVPSPTTSYWQSPPDPAIADLRSTPDLPATADYVVVGSGISGACIAFNILEKAPTARIVMLEARQACSGASGRNGGHLKAASYRAFPSNVAAHGLAEATRIAALEHSNRAATIAFARAHAIPCDLHPCRTADILLDAAELAKGTAAIAQMAGACPPPDSSGRDAAVETYTVYGAAEAAQRFLTPDALGAFEYDAGSIHPYRFVAGVLKLALARGLNLQTHTPATRLERDASDAPNNGTTTTTSSSISTTNGVNINGVNTSTSASRPPSWTIHTPRGTLRTAHVILATNGYTAALAAPFQGIVVPLRGQMSVQRPGAALVQPPDGGGACLRTTYSFLYEGGGYEYMITRPAGSFDAGSVFMGGGLGRMADKGLAQFGTCDDAVVDAAVGRYLSGAPRRYFAREHWGVDDGRGPLWWEWTGIMGVSGDGLPFVGEVPGQEGLWVSVCFNGHGMCIAFNAARGLVQMLFGEEEAALDEWFPKSYRVTAERLGGRAFEGRK